MAFTTTTDGSMLVHVSKTKAIRGKDRKGIQAYNLMHQMTGGIEKQQNSPRVDKPRVMIETMRIVGDDILTAHDSALYELLLATARNNGIDKDSHEISVLAMLRYLDIKHVDRILESLERITRTVVRYDFQDEEIRRRGSMPLILAEVSEELKSGTATLSFAIPSPVRRVVLAARDFAMLEINAFAEFSSRYTGRIYQQLALMAGMDAELRKPWEITPLDLAVRIGFPLNDDGTLHYRSFTRRCLEPVMNDIRECVGRFEVHVEEIRGTGRGRPVEKLVFQTTTALKRFEEAKSVRLTDRGLAAVRSDHRNFSKEEMPSAMLVGKAVTRTGLTDLEIIEAWKAAVLASKQNPNDAEGINGVLLYTLKKNGVGDAFALWADTLKERLRTETFRRVPPPPVKLTAPKPVAPVVTAAPDVAKVPVPAPAAAKTRSLDGISQIVIPIDNAMTKQLVTDVVATAVQGLVYTGDRQIKVVLRYWSCGTTETLSCGYLRVSETDLTSLLARLNRYIDSDIDIDCVKAA